MNSTLLNKLTPLDALLMVLSTAIRTEPQSTVEYNQRENSPKREFVTST